METDVNKETFSQPVWVSEVPPCNLTSRAKVQQLELTLMNVLVA